MALQIVKNRPPVAALTEIASIINENEVVVFDASNSFDTDGTIVTFIWGFGDGTAATGSSVTHSYVESSFYTITLTVIDNDGATDESLHSLYVRKTEVNRPPIASFTVSAETISINENVSFDASESNDPDGTIVSYMWDFGDGTTATGATTDHAYDEEGTYTVTLTVTDNDGATSTTASVVTVEIQPPMSLAIITVFGLGITALTTIILYVLFIRRKKPEAI